MVQSCISTESACFPGASYAQVRGPHISKRCRGAAATLQTIFHIVDIAAETRSQGAGGDGDISDTQDAAPTLLTMTLTSTGNGKVNTEYCSPCNMARM